MLKVPLSKVAFSPGRLIHTNEFSISTGHGATEILSHVEVADRITISIDSLKEKRYALQNHLESLICEQPPTRNSQNTPTVAHLPRAVESVPSRPYEIREFCDNEGRLLNAQVVDISSELLSASRAVGAEKQPEGKGSGGVEQLRDKDGNAVSTEEVFQRLKEALNIPDSFSEAELPDEINVSGLPQLCRVCLCSAVSTM